MKHVVEPVPGPPSAAAEIFGDNLSLAVRYAQLLAGAGVERGLIGPRESSRLWDRHLLNSAAIGELVGAGARVADAGSGAGLPGIPLAIARPDLHVTLVEPMLRRTEFLREVIDTLDIRVELVRGRIEDVTVRERIGPVDDVVCRAVAPLDKLIRWCLPSVRFGGRLLAIKGAGADDEVARLGNDHARLGAGTIEVMRCGREYLDPPTTVVVVTKSTSGSHRSARPRGRR